MKDLFLPLVFVFSSLTIYSLGSLVFEVVAHTLDARRETPPRCKPVGQNGYRCDDGNTYWR